MLRLQWKSISQSPIFPPSNTKQILQKHLPTWSRRGASSRRAVNQRQEPPLEPRCAKEYTQARKQPNLTSEAHFVELATTLKGRQMTTDAHAESSFGLRDCRELHIGRDSGQIQVRWLHLMKASAENRGRFSRTRHRFAREQQARHQSATSRKPFSA